MARKSFIPPKAQVPAAIILGVLFVALLIWRFAPVGQSAPEELLVISAGETEVEVSLDDLRKILADIKADQIERVAKGTVPPPLERDPFGPLEAAFPDDGQSQDSISQQRTEEERLDEFRASREKRLDQLQLSATSILGDSAVARVNDRYYRVGDTVEGFAVKAITERELTLEDELGTMQLRMPEVPSL